MNSCAFVNFISLLACEIAKDKSQDELAILAAFFTQLGDTLATLTIFNDNKYILSICFQIILLFLTFLLLLVLKCCW